MDCFLYIRRPTLEILIHIKGFIYLLSCNIILSKKNSFVNKNIQKISKISKQKRIAIQ